MFRVKVKDEELESQPVLVCIVFKRIKWELLILRVAMNEPSFSSFLDSPIQQQPFPFFPESLENAPPKPQEVASNDFVEPHNRSEHPFEWPVSQQYPARHRQPERGPRPNPSVAQNSYPGRPVYKDFPKSTGQVNPNPILEGFMSAANRRR